MTVEELSVYLDYVDHSREKRQLVAQRIANNPELLKPLIEIAFHGDKTISSKACWVLEFTVKQDLSFMFPFLDFFIDNLDKLRLESSIRPAAKICELLILCYFGKKENDCQLVLDDRHLEKIATACFDWLIGDHKVAAKAYSMTSLLNLGKKFQWIHPELMLILEQNYAEGSAAYKARARHTLAKLKKFKGI